MTAEINCMGCYYIFNSGEEMPILYSSKNGSLTKQKIKGGKIEYIADNVSGMFSLCLHNSQPMLIYKQNNGEVVLNDGRSSRALKNTSCIDMVCAVTSQTGMCLVYIRGNKLVIQHSGEVGTELDKCMSYSLIPVTAGGSVLMYLRRTPQVQLGYRELTATAVGNFRPIYTTSFDIADSSVCIGGNALHFAFVSVSRFVVRVMYVRRLGGELCRVKNLWEGNRCTSVCIASVGCNVYVWWESGGYIFYTVSHNGGESFGQCVKLCRATGCHKASYVQASSYGISEVMLSDNSMELYAPEEIKELILRRTESKPYVNEENDNINSINKEVIALKQQLAQKQEDIERLTHALHSKNEDAVRVEQALRQRCNALQSELNAIKAMTMSENQNQE
jgi:hypothetical protein